MSRAAVACDHNAYNRYDRVLSWSSGWILYAAAHQRVDSAALQCLHLLTVATGLASIAHWRWYRIAPLFYLDSSLASVVMGWHVFAMPSAEVLTYATLAAVFFGASCVLKCRGRTVERGFKLWYCLIHPSFRFFAFWTVMNAHGNEFSPTLMAIYWLSILGLALA